MATDHESCSHLRKPYHPALAEVHCFAMLFAYHAFPTLFNASYGNESDPEQTTKHKAQPSIAIKMVSHVAISRTRTE